LVEVVQPLT